MPDDILGVQFPASVPGVVHTDLMAAGLIDDPYLDDNESRTAWIGSTDWTYRTRIPAPALHHDRVDLVFAGLDTLATVRVNGEVVATSVNQHRSHRIPIDQRLREGDLDVEVAFSAPIPGADAASLALGYRPHVNHHPYNAIRKMACSFGWDWGIDTSTSGIWKPAFVESWSVARLAAVRPVPTLDGDLGILDLFVDLERVRDVELELVVSVDGQTITVPVAHDQTSATVRVEVSNVRRWWPRGYGSPDLYSTELELRSVGSDGSLLDRWSSEIGFRTVELETQPDGAGNPFTIVLNGQPIAIRGANWIPDDAFPHRVDRTRYSERFDQAEFARVNLLRVWGGGIYESDDFFAEADRRGVLTWQDFLLACAAYAEEDPLYSEIEAEAREAVARLGRHPSLIIFNGNNENLWGFEEWNWKHKLDGKTWGARYYYSLFPDVVAELAPHIAYTPGSPFSPGTVADDRGPAQNAEMHGSMHIWDMWNERDYLHYRDYRPRFVAEFGWQAPPTWSTLVRAVHDDPLTPESPGMLVHQKAIDGNGKLTAGLVSHFPLPDDMRTWHWAMQLNQAVAIRTAIEWYRSLASHCMGTIVWQLNDCWPVTSWSAIDGDGRPKPLLYALRRCHADVLLTVQPDGEGLRVALINDSPQSRQDALRVSRRTYEGVVLEQWEVPVAVEAHSSTSVTLPEHVARAAAAREELVVAEWSGERALWFFTDYRDSLLEPAQWTARVESSLNESADDIVEVVVSVTATNLIRDLCLEADRIDLRARAYDGMVTLLPGESVRIPLMVPRATVVSALDVDGVVRTANDLVGR
ncbi:glycoside hydrolase family 2 protein [Microcella sp.]|uniref:glycoside hydrolase family 2 protein n=1 Tax=Microcella sp. TaxID=1913979 RepID=UPI003F6EBD23